MALPTSTQAVVEGIQLADLAGKHMTDTEVAALAAGALAPLDLVVPVVGGVPAMPTTTPADEMSSDSSSEEDDLESDEESSSEDDVTIASMGIAVAAAEAMEEDDDEEEAWDAVNKGKGKKRTAGESGSGPVQGGEEGGVDESEAEDGEGGEEESTGGESSDSDSPERPRKNKHPQLPWTGPLSFCPDGDISDGDDNDFVSGGVLMTKNEEQEAILPLGEVSMDGSEVMEVGTILSLVETDGTIVIQGTAGMPPLAEGSVLTAIAKDSGSKEPLGRIHEIFGPCAMPHYTVRVEGAATQHQLVTRCQTATKKILQEEKARAAAFKAVAEADMAAAAAEASTEEAVEAATEAATEEAAEEATEAATEEAAEEATEEAAEEATEQAAEEAMEEAAEAGTEEAAEAAMAEATEEAAEAGMEEAAEAAMAEATEEATEAATEEAMEEATEEAAEAAMEEATEAGTEAATEEAAEAAMEEAVEEATEEAMEEAAEAATEETAEEAMEEATEETVEAATEEAMEAATEETAEATAEQEAAAAAAAATNGEPVQRHAAQVAALFESANAAPVSPTAAQQREEAKKAALKRKTPNPNAEQKLAALRALVKDAEGTLGKRIEHPFRRWKVGSTVYALKNHSKFLAKELLVRTGKGTDASNCNDEEAQEEEFSDDEEERKAAFDIKQRAKREKLAAQGVLPHEIDAIFAEDEGKRLRLKAKKDANAAAKRGDRGRARGDHGAGIGGWKGGRGEHEHNNGHYGRQGGGLWARAPPRPQWGPPGYGAGGMMPGSQQQWPPQGHGHYPPQQHGGGPGAPMMPGAGFHPGFRGPPRPQQPFSPHGQIPNPSQYVQQQYPGQQQFQPQQHAGQPQYHQQPHPPQQGFPRPRPPPNGAIGFPNNGGAMYSQQPPSQALPPQTAMGMPGSPPFAPYGAHGRNHPR